MGIFSKFFGRKVETQARAQDTIQPFGRPRMHHYAFVQTILPDLLRSNPQEVLDLLGKQGLGKLKVNWSVLGLQFQAQGHEFVPDGDVNKLGDIQKGKVSFNPENYLNRFIERLSADCFAVLIQLPKPQRRTEAYFVAVVVWLDTMGNYKEHRYFTLELTNIKEDGSPETMFCEVRRIGHRNHGEGCAPDKDAFLTLVRKKLLSEKMQSTIENDLKILETQGRDALKQHVSDRLNKKT